MNIDKPTDSSVVGYGVVGLALGFLAAAAIGFRARNMDPLDAGSQRR
jgi:hypothetical protein